MPNRDGPAVPDPHHPFNLPADLPGLDPVWSATPSTLRTATMPELRRRTTTLCDRQPGVDLLAVWIRYLSFGGRAGPLETWAYLTGALRCPREEAARLDHAVWELERFQD